MIACNHLDDQSISKLLMKSTSKKIPFCAHKIPFCAHKIPFCAHKAVFAFDLMMVNNAEQDGRHTCSREKADLKRGGFESLAILQLDKSSYLKCSVLNM